MQAEESVYEGALRILHPVQKPGWNYAVLGFAFVFEAISLAVALRA